MGWTRILSPN